MAIWKQLLLCLLVLAVAAVVWARYFPGADRVMAEWGIDWIPVAQTSEAINGNGGNGPAGHGSGGMGGQLGGVVTEPVLSATINDRLSAIGTGRALRSVNVTPFSNGRLTGILVESGSRLEAGDVIARLDSEAEEIAVDRAQIALADAQARLERLQSLRASNTVTTVQVNEAELAVRNAELALRDAELEFERRSIVSPIGGVVGIISVSEGNYVTSQTEIATIDDRSRILIDFWVPERFSSAISIGTPLTATSVARANEVFHGEVIALDNRIDPQSRTLRVQAGIENPDDTLRAGMSFQVQLRFPGDTYPSVDPLAVQWGTDGAFVWIVEDGIARRQPIRIVQRNTDSVLVAADLPDGVLVVTEGVHNVREGREVRLARRPGEQDRRSEEQPSAGLPTSGS
jgi:RND family efflux transporter MFP subunit